MYILSSWIGKTQRSPSTDLWKAEVEIVIGHKEAGEDHDEIKLNVDQLPSILVDLCGHHQTVLTFHSVAHPVEQRRFLSPLLIFLIFFAGITMITPAETV